MGQRIKPGELRDMLRVARKLRASAEASQDAEYIALFLRGALALEERVNQLAYSSSDPEIPDMAPLDEEHDAALHQHVDLLC